MKGAFEQADMRSVHDQAVDTVPAQQENATCLH